MSPSSYLAFSARLLLFIGLICTESIAQQPPSPPIGVSTEAPASAPAASFVMGRSIKMIPTEKRPLVLSDGERNPYVKRTPEAAQSLEEEGDAEELRIRAHLNSLTVSGRSQGPNGLRVLLSDIILEEGLILPILFEEQSELLRVDELTNDKVTLSWLNRETHEPTGRTMQLTYDLSPVVSYALQGQVSQGANGAPQYEAPKMGVLQINELRKQRAAKLAEANEPPANGPEVFNSGQ